VPWEEDFADQPLADGNWEVIGPSPVPWSDRNATPREMTRADMDRVKADFVRATLMGEQAGFDMLELHCGHGYLLSSFLTPISNQRTDEYGGSVENRLRYPLEVFEAMRAAWPKHKPMSVRISATDWHEDGLSAEDSIAIAQAFERAGADLIDVSAGQTTPLARPVYGRMFQTPFSDRIRNEGRVRTMAVGNIYEPDHVRSLVASGWYPQDARTAEARLRYYPSRPITLTPCAPISRRARGRPRPCTRRSSQRPSVANTSPDRRRGRRTRRRSRDCCCSRGRSTHRSAAARRNPR
jgi:2,4-dienoyl-CoA reductase-like NADH-dependent reductase (Old Yellow Enzyme family)